MKNTFINILKISFILLCYGLPAHATTLSSLDLFQQENSYVIDRQALSNFYDDNSTYIWLNKQQQTKQAYDALDFISASTRHGLQANDYHYSILKQLDPSLNVLSAQKFDVLLTDGLLKLIHDLSVGRLKANEADPEWFIPQAEFDASLFLQQALLKKYLGTELETLIPSSKEYSTLTQALSRYQDYVARGGWPVIPPTTTIRPDDSHQLIPMIKARLAFENNQIKLDNASLEYDLKTEQAVRRFQQTHGLKVDGVIGKITRNAMNISASDRLQQIKVAIERRRWMPDKLEQQYLFINLANYSLKAIENGNETLAMRVIVGRKKRQTPSFRSEMNNIVLNPYWNVPRKLAVKDLLPKQQDNFNYFYTHEIRVFKRENGQKIEQDPYLIDWLSLNENNFPYILRQDPGEHNALGRIKFLFPNDWAIYLHDTNHRGLFNKTIRSLSSGCIRVEDPIALANFSLANRFEPKTLLELIESKENRGRKVTKSLAIYAVYFTVWVGDNGVNFYPDVYQRDKKIAKSL